MKNRPWLLTEATLKMCRRTPIKVAVLPFGATEPHNLHLPYGCDFLAVEAIAEKACEITWKKGARAIALPVVPFGTNSNFAGFPGFVDLNPTTHLAILRDIVRSLETCNVGKLVIINGHGGNGFGPFLRELWPATKVFISMINWWQIEPDLFKKVIINPGGHGDEMETSLMLHLYPHLVNLNDADAGTVQRPRLKALRDGWAVYVRPWKKLTPNSGAGNPKLASAEKGRILFQAVTRKIAGYLVELAKAKMDSRFPY